MQVSKLVLYTRLQMVDVNWYVMMPSQHDITVLPWPIAQHEQPHFHIIAYFDSDQYR